MATCKQCGFKKLCVLTSLTLGLLRFRPFHRPRHHRGAASNVSRQKAAFVHERTAARAYDDELEQCEQDL